MRAFRRFGFGIATLGAGVAVGAFCLGGGGTTTTSTSIAAPAGTAKIFVSATGDDSTCTRSSTALTYANAAGHICATPVKACQIASDGDTVIIEDGNYANVDFGQCRGHESYTNNIVLEPEPGHECPMTYPTIPAGQVHSCDVTFTSWANDGWIGQNGNKTCGVTGNPLPSTLTAAQRSSWINHLTIQGVAFADSFTVQCAAFITLKDDVGSYWTLRQGSYQWTIDGGDWNTADAGIGQNDPKIGDSTSSTSDFPPTEAVTVKNAIIRDFISTSSNVGHGDGLFVEPSYDTHIIKNIIVRDDCIPLYVNFDVWNSIGVHGLWVIGNAIHVDTNHSPGDGRCNQALSLGNNAQSDTVVAFNSVEGPIKRSNTTEVNTNIRIVGNVAQEIDATNGGSSAGCGTGTTANYNVLYSSLATDCGDASNATFGSDTQQFTSYDTLATDGSIWWVTAVGDYGLQAGVAAVDKVPTSWCSTDSVTTAVCAALSTDISGNARPAAGHSSFYDAGAFENR